MICLACGDAGCEVCEPIRVGILSRQMRRDEALDWIERNLKEKVGGREVVMCPQEPEDLIRLVMAVMAYCREPDNKSGSPEPMQCERFKRIEWREPANA